MITNDYQLSLKKIMDSLGLSKCCLGLKKALDTGLWLERWNSFETSDCSSNSSRGGYTSSASKSWHLYCRLHKSLRQKKSWRRNWRQITHQPNADLMSQIISRRHQGKHSYWKTFLLPGPGLGHETWKAIRKSGVQWNKFHLWFCEFLAVNFYQKAGRFPSSETRMESPNHCRWFPAPLCQVIHKIQQRRSNDCYFKLCGLICGQDGLQLAKSLAWETPAMSFCSEWNSRYWLAISQLLITNKKTSTSVCLVHQYHNVCIYDMYIKIS